MACALWKQRSVHTVVMLSWTSIFFCHLVTCAGAHIFSLKAKLQYTAKIYFVSIKTRNISSLSHFTSLMVIWAFIFPQTFMFFLPSGVWYCWFVSLFAFNLSFSSYFQQCMWFTSIRYYFLMPLLCAHTHSEVISKDNLLKTLRHEEHK